MFGILINDKLFPAKIMIVKYFKRRKRKREGESKVGKNLHDLNTLC